MFLIFLGKMKIELHGAQHDHPGFGKQLISSVLQFGLLPTEAFMDKLLLRKICLLPPDIPEKKLAHQEKKQKKHV